MSNTFFQGGEQFCREGLLPPLRPPGYGPAYARGHYACY